MPGISAVQKFDCIVVCPAAFGRAEMAAAAARGGGIGVIDLVNCESGPAEKAFDQLLTLADRSTQRIGLRFDASSADLARRLAARCGREVATIRARTQNATDAARELDSWNKPHFVEVLSVDEAGRLAEQLPVDIGFIGVAAEAGGWCGPQSGFLLACEIAERKRGGDPRRWYLRGACGPHVAAACWFAGLDGVVLGDEGLLFPESPLTHRERAVLSRAEMGDYVSFGDAFGAGARTLALPECPAARGLVTLEREIESAADTGARSAEWIARVSPVLGWGDPSVRCWPVGQGTALSGVLCARYVTIGRLVGVILRIPETACREVETAASALGPDGPFAREHGVRFPIVQGPMTRVSDVPAFVAAVSEHGALGTLALGVMPGEQAERRLAELAALVGGKPFGVGLLAFLEPELLAAQTAAVVAAKPSFAILAGGRVDQFRQMSAAGVKPYLHAPSPRVLRLFVDQGVDRVVLEGRECGGHVGPCHSFALWEAAVAELATEGRERARVQCILFAGGIHDVFSAAMVALMAAPLVARGCKIGVLVGTAYLATREAVVTGAIVPEFQRRLFESTGTATLVSAPGHANRCLVTPFVEEFDGKRRALLREKASSEDMRRTLDEMLLGRLRIATKGRRHDGEKIVSADQAKLGMYMSGDAARRIERETTLADLHDALSVQAADRLRRLAGPGPVHTLAPRPANIAVVGMSLTLPGAPEPESYWRNLLAGASAIREVPAERWDWRLIYDPQARAGDKSVSKWGGFIDVLAFDPAAYGIPPSSVKNIAPSQILVLEMAQRALTDAGYGTGGFNRERASVIVAAADAGGFLGNELVTRSVLPFINLGSREGLCERLSQWSEESFAGTINSVVAGRVANRLNLGGANYTVDAACASGLTALALASDELLNGRADLVVLAAVDSAQTPYHYMAFSSTGALSPRGKASVFDKGADGTVISEGAVALILKRLTDAERDGDRIYGVIRGAANSSDGKAAGLTAPHPAGQRRAMRRAYEVADVSAASIQFYEAHGTGTPVGDKAELETISTVLADAGCVPKACALGSVKSLIGHTKTAAGLASLAKVLLALHYRVLPPHAGVETPLDELEQARSPLFLLDRPRPWVAPRAGTRRAAVSAFGFGGTNCHVVVEDAPNPMRDAARGGPAWPCELFVLGAANQDGLVRAARDAEAALQTGAYSLRDVAWTLACNATGAAHGAMFTAGDAEEAGGKLKACRQHLEAGTPLPTGMLVGRRADAPARVAVLFPGQGGQRPHMAAEAAIHIAEVAQALEQAEHAIGDALPRGLVAAIYPEAAFSEQARARQHAALTDTRMAQPAIGALCCGLFRFLQRLGLRPAMTAGHSYGEYVALAAAEAMRWDDLWRLSAARGQAMAKADAGRGAMSIIFANRERVAALLNDFSGAVIANHNSPDQIAISGQREAVVAATEHAKAQGISVQMLTTGGAYHSPLMEGAREELRHAIQETYFRAPRIPVFSNRDGTPYADDPADIQARLAAHLAEPVDFVRMVRKMRAAGTDLFVEVGPVGVLGGMVKRILDDQDATPIVSATAGTLRELLGAVGRLWYLGADLDLSKLFEHRAVRRVLAAHAPRQQPGSATTVLMSGFGIHLPSGESARRQLLTAKTARGERAALSIAPHATVEADPLLLHTDPPSIPAAASRAAEPLVFNSPAPDIDNGYEPTLAVYREYQNTMRHFLQTQEKVMEALLSGAARLPVDGVRTIADDDVAVIAPAAPHASEPGGDGVDRAVGEAARTSPAPSVQAVASASGEAAVEDATATDALTREAATQMVVGLIGELSGYPPAMLHLDLDLEAELGIDSIKRLELLERIVLLLASPHAEKVRAEASAISRLRTLAAWTEAILAAQPAPFRERDAAEDKPSTAAMGEPPGAGAVPSASPPQHRATDAASESRSDTRQPSTVIPFPRAPQRPLDGAMPEHLGTCPAYAMVPRSSSLTFVRRDWLDGLHVVAGGDGMMTQFVATALRSRGATPVIIPYASLANEDDLAAALAAARASHGRVRGIVHLAGAQSVPAPRDLAAWRDQARAQAKSMYQLIQLSLADLLERLDGRAGRVIAASAFDGHFGRSAVAAASSPLAGASQGLLKSLSLEHPEIMVKCVDLDPRLPRRDSALLLIDEYTIWGGRIEIGYRGGQRSVFDVDLLPDRHVGALDLRDAVILAVGGARGITAAVVRALAAAGSTVVVTGRSPIGPARPEAIEACRNEAALRAWLCSDNDGARTPRQIENEIRAILRDREIRSTLADLGGRGIDALYRPLDVRDDAAVRALVGEMRQRFGRIDVVLHGAGVIEDKLFADKDAQSFDRVFDTKVDGAFNLAHALELDSLKVFAMFGSVAGRFGNRGQADYSAANEVLNRFGLELRAKWPQLATVVFNWGPWEGAGMASENINARFRDRGILPIPSADGAAFAVRHLDSATCELIVGSGNWSEGEFDERAFFAADASSGAH
jgi:acyl transferase domain-containing protein/NAD(P)H-dependent flavin oxidoreductase YrpB (nitropropane dioxygenase family)/NADP-dependent 3-hydroxy acid dehydrogenase YdfG